jgi:hypothetical protein
MMARMRSLLAVLIAAGLVVVAPATAHAERAYFADTGGDVWSHRGGAPTQEVAHTDGDVSSVIVNHRKRTVRMVLSVVTIDADGGSRFRPTLFRFTLVNGRGLTKVFDLNQDNELRVRRLAHGQYSATRCRWVRHSVDTHADRVSVTIPRSCMRKPKAVRLEATVVDWDRSGVGYVDDAYTSYDTSGAAHGSSPLVKRG